MLMRVFGFFILLIFLQLSRPAAAAEYINKKLFDFPDPTTAPRMANGCAKWASFTTVKCRGLKCGRSTARVCVNPTHIQVALLRRDVSAVVTGPDNIDAATRNAAEGYILGCVASAIAVSGAGPQIVAAPGTFVAAFKACLLGISTEGAVGAILRQVNIHLDSSQTHWAPL
jgi:hypothetical protein